MTVSDTFTAALARHVEGRVTDIDTTRNLWCYLHQVPPYRRRSSEIVARGQYGDTAGRQPRRNVSGGMGT